MRHTFRHWARVGAVGGMVFFVSLAALIVLMPLSHSVPEPAFDASSGAFLAYARSEAELPFALTQLGVVGLFGFVVFAAVLAERFRLEEERSTACRFKRCPWIAILNLRGSDSLPAHQPLRLGHLFDARGAASVERDPQDHPKGSVECQPEKADLYRWEESGNAFKALGHSGGKIVVTI